MTRRQLERRLQQLGWRLARHGRRHDVWTNDEREIAVPRHKEINEHTAKAIITDAQGET
jgi:mRNA interferase HicA